MKYTISHIPVMTKKRSGRKVTMNSITIHSTANPNSTAMNERNWLLNPTNTRSASWHIAVDQNQAVEAIPLNEQAYHSGSTLGNNTSIGIEMCESGNRAKVVDNTVKLVAKMLKERGWGIAQLRRHYDWSGKNCPRIFSSSNWTGWTVFKQNVQKELNRLSIPNKPNKPKVQVVSDWAKVGHAFVTKYNISDGDKPQDVATREEVWVMLERLAKLIG